MFRTLSLRTLLKLLPVVAFSFARTSTPSLPPFANSSYSCRCLPRSSENNQTHQYLCELRTYIRALNPHIAFLTNILKGNATEVDTWFMQSARSVITELAQQTKGTEYTPTLTSLAENLTWLLKTGAYVNEHQQQFHNEIALQFSKFPCREFAQKLHSKTLQQVFNLMTLASSPDVIANFLTLYFNALSQFTEDGNATFLSDLFHADLQEKSQDPEHIINCAFVITKDIASIVYIFHVFIAQSCAQSFTGKEKDALFAPLNELDNRKNAFFNLIEIYNLVEGLPIEKTVTAITRFVQRFIRVIERLQQSAEDGFVGWLKSKWVYIPLAVGLIIVKITLSFFTDDSAEYGYVRVIG